MRKDKIKLGTEILRLSIPRIACLKCARMNHFTSEILRFSAANKKTIVEIIIKERMSTSMLGSIKTMVKLSQFESIFVLQTKMYWK